MEYYLRVISISDDIVPWLRSFQILPNTFSGNVLVFIWIVILGLYKYFSTLLFYVFHSVIYQQLVINKWELIIVKQKTIPREWIFLTWSNNEVQSWNLSKQPWLLCLQRVIPITKSINLREERGESGSMT